MVVFLFPLSMIPIPRLDRSNRADTETKISGNAEIQMMQSRVNSLAEEMRMSMENGKRWADQVWQKCCFKDNFYSSTVTNEH